MNGPERLSDLLPAVVADLARRCAATNDDIEHDETRRVLGDTCHTNPEGATP